MTTTDHQHTPGTPRGADDGRPALQQILEDAVDAGITGITLRVRDEHGAWTGTAGHGDPEGTTGAPPIEGHVRIGSSTKTFVAALVLSLVAEGRIALDDPVGPVLPDLDLDPRVSLRMLLQHTSGIFNHTGEYYPDGSVVPGIPATTAGREWVEHRFDDHDPRDLARLALSRPARFEPGTDWSYSNSNYVIARLLVEALTGESVVAAMERRIISPLGLIGTLQPTAQTDIPAPHARAGFRIDEDGAQRIVDVTRQNPSWISSGGDMISTSRDLQTFLRALMGGQLLPRALRDEMLTPRPTPIPGAGYGLGVFVEDLGARGTVVTHHGGAAGHGALMAITPDGRRVMTGTMNYVDDAGLSLAVPFQQLSQALVRAVFAGEAPAQG